jgi:hypothetical protein
LLDLRISRKNTKAGESRLFLLELIQLSFNTSTGFVTDALIDGSKTELMEIITEITPPIIKSSGDKVTLYENPLSHVLSKYQVTGIEIINPVNEMTAKR